MALSVRQQIKARIQADVDLALLIPGGVWSRPLKPNVSTSVTPTRGSTPDAFDPLLGFVRRCIVVGVQNETANPLGVAGSYYGFPTLWFYTPDIEVEVEIMEDVWQRVYSMMHGTRFQGRNNEGISSSVVGRTGPLPVPEFDDTALLTMQLQIDSVWRVL